MITHVYIKKDEQYQNNEWFQLYQMLEEHLEYLLPVGQPSDLICAAMRTGTLVKGKRIRPLLLLLTVQDMGIDIKTSGTLDLACAVEMIHAASLILDDIPSMDNALTRRSHPTIHCQYGQNVAILTTIALISRAFEVIATASNLSATQKSAAIAELSSAIGFQGLAQGQFQDLHNNKYDLRQEDIELTNHLKTSVLFRAALQMTAIVADASLQIRKKLSYFAQELGQAFQLLDDLSDSYKHTGKDRFQDKGKFTLVQMLGVEGAKYRLHEHLISAEAHLVSICHHGIATSQYMQTLFHQKLTVFNLN